MAYDNTKPTNDGFLADFPPDMREQLRAIIQDAIVNSGLLQGLPPGNSQGQIPVSNGTICTGLNAEKVGGKLPNAFADSGHGHNVATSLSNGFMANTDKTKLDGIATGAKVNQMAFSNVLVGNTTIQADSETDTLEMVAGANITLTPDVVNDRVTIAVNGKVASAAQADNATTAINCTGNSVTATTANSLIPSTSNYGSAEVTGGKTTYAGLHFPYVSKTWVTSEAQGVSFGVFRDAGGWDWYFGNDGALKAGTVPYSHVTGIPTSLPANGGTSDACSGRAEYGNRLRRNDANDNYNVQTNWDGTYWNLKGYNGDAYHAPCMVAYAESAGKIGGKTVEEIQTSANVAILTGTVTHGGTIPLPAGFTQAQCHWMVSTYKIYDSSGGGWTYCYADSNRVVNIQAVAGPNIANYIIIGVK